MGALTGCRVSPPQPPVAPPGSSPPPIQPTPPPPADPIQTRLDSMSLDEKLGQMVLIGLTGQEVDATVRDLIQAQHVGGVILYQVNISTTGQTVSLLNSLKAANASNKSPLWLSLDQEGGKVSRMPDEFAKLPTSRAVGQTNSQDYALAIGSLLGEEVKSVGFNMNFAPVLDIDSNPNNPVIGDRSFGPTPDLVSKLGIAEMKGLQSQQVVPVVKHFPGHGDTSVDSHLDLPVVNKSLESLRTFELQPFRQAVRSGADAVMIAHILLPKLDDQHPATFSKPVITGLLREELGFNGVVITDDMTMGAITGHFDIGQAAVQSVNAGADIMLVAHDYTKATAVLNALKQAAANGDLPQATIARSVYRILALKEKYHLTNQPTAEPDVKTVNAHILQVLDKYAGQK
jgi:beta-N-acetylhexosaminidase